MFFYFIGALIILTILLNYIILFTFYISLSFSPWVSPRDKKDRKERPTTLLGFCKFTRVRVHVHC
jgi:hypothetical protein